MRPAVLFLLACTAVPTALAQDSLRISERVGATLDAEERAYFGLFPRVAGFVEASFFASGDSVAVHVRRAGMPDTTVHLASATFAALGEYVGRFEADGRHLLVSQASTMARHVRFPHTYRPTRPLAVRFTDGRRASYRVLRATADGLLVEDGPGPYAWRDTAEAVWLRPAQLSSVTLPANSSRVLFQGLGAGVLASGLLLGLGGLDRENVALSALSVAVTTTSALLSSRRLQVGGQARRYAEVWADLRGSAAFPQQAPPELALVPLPAGQPPPPPPRPRTLWDRVRPPHVVSVSLTGGRLGYPASSDGGRFTYLSAAADANGRFPLLRDRTSVVYPDGFVVATATFTPLRFVGVGVEGTRMSQGKPTTTAYHRLTGTERYGFAEVRLPLPGPLRRATLLGAVGRGTGTYRSQGYFPVSLGSTPYYTNQAVPLFEDRFDRTTTTPFRLLRAGLLVRVTPTVSLRGQITRRRAAEELVYPYYSYTYRLGASEGALVAEDGFSVPLSRTDVSFGVQLHR